MDVPAYPFEKVSLDISGPYGETLRGNVYIVSFVDWLASGNVLSGGVASWNVKRRIIKTVL